MRTLSLPVSHFDLLCKPVCHVSCAQFERQWPPENLEPLSHPISKNFQWLSLWHVPQNHEVWIESEDMEKAQNWIESYRKTTGRSPQIRHSKHLPSLPLYFWGNSPKALEWAQKQNLPVANGCSPAITRKVHDKTWLESWRTKPLLEERSSEILLSYNALKSLIQRSPEQGWMFKRAWSAAGTGNRIYRGQGPLPTILEKWMEKDSCLIAQPLLNKTIDFSSLWYISSESSPPSFFASTQMLIDEQSRYTGCRMSSTPSPFKDHDSLWDQHLEEVSFLLEKMKQEGYFGYVGFDGLLYQTTQGLQQTVIEINARQTLAMHLVSAARSLNCLPATAKLSRSPALKNQGRPLLPPNAGLINIHLLESS